MTQQRVLVIGQTDIGRRMCWLLQARGVAVVHLDDPSDSEIRTLLEADFSAVAVLMHDDIRALRYAMTVEHLRPGIRLFATIFGRTVRAQLSAQVPNSVVMSPAAISVPSMVAAAIEPTSDAIRRLSGPFQKEWVAIADGEPYTITRYTAPLRLRLRGLLGILRGQLRPYDRGTGVLLLGALGLAVVTTLDTWVGTRHDSLLVALHDAVLTTTTITTPEIEKNTAQLLWSTSAALLAMVFTAMFGAGIVHHLLEGRHIGIIGRRVAPKSGHVIIAGMGQVGIRLAQELRELGVAVVCVEQRSDAPTLPIAKTLGIPVIIDSASSQAGLKRAGIKGAHALVAAGSDERDNIAIAIAARAASPEINLVLRAGSDDAIDETRSLFRIGKAVDVNALTAAFVAQAVVSDHPYLALHAEHDIVVIDERGAVVGSAPSHTQWCTCS